MKGLRVVAAVVAVAAGYCVFGRWRVSGESGRTGAVGVEPVQVFDFGERPAGNVVDHTFVVRNPFNTALRIRKTSTSCSCTVTSVGGSVIAPGAGVEVAARVHLPEWSQQVRNVVQVDFDGAPSVELCLKGEAVAELPPEVPFGNIRRGERVERLVTMRSVGGVTRKVLGLSSDSRYLIARIGTSRENSRDTDLVLATVVDLPYGAFKVPLRITTDDALDPVRVVTITGYVLRPIELRESVLTLGVIRDPLDGLGEIDLYAPYGGDIVVESCSTDPRSGIQCGEARHGASPDEVKIPFRVSPDFDGDFFKGKVVVRAHIVGASCSLSVDVYAMKSIGG